MKNLYDVKNDLYNYVKKYNDLKEEQKQLFGENILYDELIVSLNKLIAFDYSDMLNFSILLETLYGRKHNDLQDCIFMCRRLRLLDNKDKNELNRLNSIIRKKIDEIKKDFENNKEKYSFVTEELSSKKEKMIVARRIQSCLKYGQTITKDDAILLKEILVEVGYNNDDVASVIENVFIRNKSIITKKNGIYFNTKEKYKFLDLFSLGGEMFELPVVEDPLKLKMFAQSIYSVLDGCSREELLKNYVQFLPSIGKEVKDLNEFEYTLICVLEKLRGSLDEKIDLIKDSDFIMDLGIKNELAVECYGLIEKYNLIRNYLDDKLDNYGKDEKNDNHDNNQATEVVENKFFYLVNDSERCYLFDDIKDMPFEYISKVKELMDDFKHDVSNGKHKKLLYSGAGFSEIKGDQIRIIYKKIDSNSYLFYGAFIKKDDWKYRVDFKRVIGRTGAISKNPLEIEANIDDYINNNQRKWSR